MRFSRLLLGATLDLAVVPVIGSGTSRALDAGDPGHGKQVFAKKACPSLGAGVNRVGPSLLGVTGRSAGSEADFKYSDAMKNAQASWTPETLDRYLVSPRKMVPGTKMAFPGLTKDKDRADLIAYLEQAAGTSP